MKPMHVRNSVLPSFLLITLLILAPLALAHGDAHVDPQQFQFSPDADRFTLPTDDVPNFCKNPTIRSIRNGAWSDPLTWDLRRVPTDEDHVRVTAGDDVLYDLSSSPDIHCVGVTGTLDFDTRFATELRVVHLMVYQGGHLQIGTPTVPAVRDVEIIFRDVPLDVVDDGVGIFDPDQYGNGLLNLGKVSVYGAPLEHTFVRLAQEPHAGDTQLVVEHDVNSWMPGDRLILPDTRRIKLSNHAFDAETHDEELVIASVSGNRITLTSPLQFDHLGARDADLVLEYLPHVGNLDRSVVFRSENPDGVRGHTLHLRYNAEVDIRYAAFRDLGRTTIEQWDSAERDDDGNVVSIPSNQLGRYSIHLHHIIGPRGLTAGQPQFIVMGNAVEDSPKWGIAIHDSSYGYIGHNVVYKARGAGIATEDGDEVYNLIEKNFISTARGSGQHIYTGAGRRNFGHQGVGIWLHGPQNFVRDNVAANTRLTGFAFGQMVPTENHAFGAFNPMKIPRFPGADTSVEGEYTLVDVNNEGIVEFADNEAYGGMQMAIDIWEVGARRSSGNGESPYLQSAGQSAVRNFVGWHFYNTGVKMRSVNNLILDGLVLRGDHERSQAVGFGSRTRMNRNIKILNADVQGLKVGFEAPVTDALIDAVSIDPAHPPFVGTEPLLIKDSHFRNVRNIVVTPIPAVSGTGELRPPRELHLVNTELVPYNYHYRARRGTVSKNIAMDYRERNNLVQRNVVKVFDHQGIPGDNFQVYFREQAADFIVPETTDRVFGAPVSGLTNAETLAQFGIAIGGEVAPCTDDATYPLIDGYVCPLGTSFVLPEIDFGSDDQPSVPVLDNQPPSDEEHSPQSKEDFVDDDNSDVDSSSCNDGGFACSVAENHHVDDAHLLLQEPGFSVFRYTRDGVCPAGNFVLAPRQRCTLDGENFRSWAVLDFDHSGQTLHVKAGHTLDNCKGDSCKKPIRLPVYTTDDYDGTNTIWQLSGKMTLQPGETRIDSFSSGPIDAALLGRGGYGPKLSDTVVYYAQLE